MFRFAFTIAVLVTVTATQAQERKPATGMQFAGFVTASKTVRIQSRIDSVVTDVFFKEGDFVERGTLLFKLDPKLH